MKSYTTKGILFLTCLTLFVSCSRFELDLAPQGSLLDKDVVNSSKNMESLLLGVYNSLGEQHGNAQGENFYASPTNWQFDVVSDDAYKGSNTGDQGPLLDLELFKHNAANPYLDRKWKVLYEGIVRANNFIKLARVSTVLADAAKKQMIAEARFLRGHFYFQLYRVFRNVPWVDETTPEDVMTKNDQDILPKIIEDFEAAKADLPVDAKDMGRPTKYAAMAYLGKVYLYRADYTAIGYRASKKADGSDFDPATSTGDFAKAKAEFDLVKTSGKFGLITNFSDIYDPTRKKENDREVIFAVRNSVKDGAPAGEHGDLGSMLNAILNGPGGLDKNGCCGFYVPSENLVNAYKTKNGLPIDSFTGANFYEFNDDAKTGGNMSDFGIESKNPFTPYAGDLDPRLDYTIGRRGIPFLDYGDHPGQAWARSPADQGNYSRKKRFISKAWYAAGYGVVPTNFTFTAIDFHILRYDDLLLMLAECEVELGNLATARDLVNQIRNRAKNSTYLQKGGNNAATYRIEPYSATGSEFADKTKARNAVRFERRLELALEGSRFYDLVRWGIAQEVINTDYAPEEPVSYKSNINFTAGKNEFFPIPQNQIDLSQKDGKSALTQNPGY